MLIPDQNGYLCPECGKDYLEEGEAGNLGTGPDSIPIMWCPTCEATLTERDFMDYYEPGRDDE